MWAGQNVLKPCQFSVFCWVPTDIMVAFKMILCSWFSYPWVTTVSQLRVIVTLFLIVHNVRYNSKKFCVILYHMNTIHTKFILTKLLFKIDELVKLSVFCSGGTSPTWNRTGILAKKKLKLNFLIRELRL